MGKSPDASPSKSLVKELELLQERFRTCLASYGSCIEADLTRLQQEVRTRAASGTPTPARLHEIRDMLGLCRGLEVRVDNGRRKDLKKFEMLIEDLKMLMERW